MAAAAAANVKPVVVDCINACTAVSDDEIKKCVDALQIQLTRDFATVWDAGAMTKLNFISKSSGKKGRATTRWLTFLDNSDVAGALGYHDLTTSGRPLGKVFVKTNIDDSASWTVAASHELLEMTADPEINWSAQNPADNKFYALEVGDPVEADQFGYEIDGVRVSNFVYPAYFDAYKKGRKLDFMGKVQAPYQLLSGGYILVFDPSNPSQGWQQVFGAGTKMKYSMRPAVGSRRERRRIPRSHWMESSLDKGEPEKLEVSEPDVTEIG